MRFVCLRSAGCVRGWRYDERERERERERDVVTLGHNLGSSTVHPLYCTVLYRASSEDEEGDQDDD